MTAVVYVVRHLSCRMAEENLVQVRDAPPKIWDVIQVIVP